VQPGINTQTDFKKYVELLFPGFSATDVTKVLANFHSSQVTVNPADPLFPTLGDTGLTALNQSAFATGQQQRAFNLYAEATFICPSYWIADAFSKNKYGGYKYQYSVVPAMHTTDLPGYFGPVGGASNMSPAFQKAFMSILSHLFCVPGFLELT
jgi:carboxylesterase type B